MLYFLLLACDPTPAVAVEPAVSVGPAVAPVPNVVVVGEGGERLSPEAEKAIGQAIDTLQNGAPEPVPAAVQAAAQDPAKLVGRWQITETRGKVDGVASEPAQPIMPTAWVLAADGRMKVDGGMQIDATYTYTGEKLVISGMGPILEYEIVKLTDTDLEVVHRITAGSLVIENGTVLKKVLP